MPHSFADLRNYIYAIVGAKFSGKSHFLVGAVEAFRHDRGPTLHLTVRPADQYTDQRYEKLRKRLCDGHLTLDPTATFAQQPENARPLVFSAKLRTPDLFGRHKVSGAFLISFFDSPGEDLESDDRTTNFSRYVYNSDALIALVDPTEFAYVRDRLPPDTTQLIGARSPIEIISRVSRIIRVQKDIKATKPIKTPIAITLTKTDAIRSLIDGESPIFQSPPNVGGYPRTDGEALSAEVRTLLATWLTPHINQIIEDDFASFKYFGVSALGGAPSGEALGMIKPHRVTGPFEWLLYNSGLLRAGDAR